MYYTDDIYARQNKIFIPRKKILKWNNKKEKFSTMWPKWCNVNTTLSIDNVLLHLGTSSEALKSGLSDMEYLRSKVVQTDETMEEEEEKSDDEEDCGPVEQTESALESGENTSKTKISKSSKDKKQSKVMNEKQEVTKGIYIFNHYCTI